MRKKMILLQTSLLSFCMMMAVGLSLSACSSDDDELGGEATESFGGNFDPDTEVGPSYENPFRVDEERFWLQFQLFQSHGGVITWNDFQTDESICFRFLVDPSTDFYATQFLDGGDLIVDDYFMAVYKANGELYEKIDKSQLVMITLLRMPTILRIEYGRYLPAGDYYTKFKVKYNTAPGAEEKVWKTRIFRIDFTVK